MTEPDAAAERLRADDWVGTELGGHWRLLEVVDRCGHGLCFQGRGGDTDPERVVVKLVPIPPNDGEALVERHRQATARLMADPPLEGVVRVVDTGVEAPGVLWIVTEEAPGVRLSDVRTREGPMAPDVAARLGAAVCRIVGEAHGRGVLHLALTGDSVYLSGDAEAPTVTIDDFSLGLLLQGPGRSAPELVRGLPDGRADVWAIGTLVATLWQGHAQTDQARLATVLTRCRSQSPRGRPAAVDRLREELEAAAEGRRRTPAELLVEGLRSMPRTAVIYIVGVALGAALVAALALSVGTDPATRDLARGEAALAIGDATGAALIYERALTRDPEGTDAYRGLAMAREALGLAASAIEAWRAYLASNPSSAEAHRGLGRLLRREGRLAEARRHAELAVRLAPSEPAGHTLLGGILVDAGDAEGAARALERAVALTPSDPEVHAALGEILAALPDHEEGAREALAEAVRLEPRRVDRRMALADFLAGPGEDCLGALTHYRWVLSQSPNHGRAEHGLGRCLAQSPEERQRAERHLLRATELIPDDAAAHLSLARYRRRYGAGCEAAQSTIARAVELAPDDPGVLHEAASCQEEAEEWCAAERSWQRLGAVRPEAEGWRHRLDVAHGECARTGM